MRSPASGKIEKLILALSMLCTVLMITAGLFKRIELIRLNSENVALTAEINTLRDENRRLHITYESAFDLRETENYAKTVLGMAKPGTGQITKIENSFILSNEEADGDKN